LIGAGSNSRGIRSQNGPITARTGGVDSPCVLVVDDDPSVLRMIVSLLEREGYEIAQARNGLEALRAMDERNVQLVVLDLMMPVMNGWEVLEVRAANPALQRIPVVVVTANIGPDAGLARDKGISALLPKPFDLSALKAIITTCLGHPNGLPAKTATTI
jgi:CheY-like chemotaxis protein